MHHQKMRTEISKAKREADHFKSNVEKSKRQEKASRKRAATSPAAAAASTATVASGSPASPGGTAPEGKRFKLYEFRQKETDETIKKRKSAAENAVAGEGSSSGRVSSPPAAAGKSKGKKKNKSKGKTAQAKSSSSVASADRSAFLQSVFSSKE